MDDEDKLIILWYFIGMLQVLIVPEFFGLQCTP